MPLPPQASALFWGLLTYIFLWGPQAINAQQSERSNSFLEAGVFMVDAFAASQGGQSSAFTVSDEANGSLISGRPFQGFFNPGNGTVRLHFTFNTLNC